MFPTFISILDIQSWWEVPSIAHFCSLFRTAFNLLDFDIEDLEEALLTDGTEEPSWLQELIVKLLTGCLPNNEISTFNYQMFLRRLFREKCKEHDRYNPFNTDIDFQLLPLRTKVDILYALCDFRLDAEDVLEQLKNLEADSLRVEPLGYDDNDSAFWYFYGTRLYREDFNNKNNKKGKSVWQVVCFTEEDWFQLAKKFKKSTSKAERQLYCTLSENFLPELPRLFCEKERLARKRLLENLPRRTSSRLDTKRKQEKEQKVVQNDNTKEENVVPDELQKKRDLEKRRLESYERRNRIKEDEEKDSEIEDRKSRYEMAGNKKRDKKSKTKQRNLSNSSSSSRDRSVTRSSSRSIGKSDTSKERKANKAAAANNSTTVGRQTNNSLASATGQIVIQQVSNPNRKKLKTSLVFRQTDEDLQTGMHKILDYVKNHEDAWPFVEPVEEEYAPNYYTVIRKPMDLQSMEERLDSGYYKSYSRFRDDFQLIVDNCRLYNGAENEYTEMVGNLLTIFEKATDRYLDQITSSDEEIAVEFPDLNKDDKSKSIKGNASVSSNKPALVASTDKKPDKKPESSVTKDHHVKRSNSNVDLFESNKRDKKQSKRKVVTETSKIPTKKEKIISTKKEEKNKTKKKKVGRKPNNVKSGALKNRSRSNSFSSVSQAEWSSSPPPSSIPSSPEIIRKNSKNSYFSDEDSNDKIQGRGKQKDKWKDIIKDDVDKKSTKHRERSVSPPKQKEPKDKHNKLRETIEKLKAKSEISSKLKNLDEDRSKENNDDGKSKKHDTQKSVTNKSKWKKTKADEVVSDLEEESNTLDSLNSNKKNVKKDANKSSGNKMGSYEALTLATEQTLKDINKWLDGTAQSSEFSSASNSPSHDIIGEDVDGKKDPDNRRKFDKPLSRKDPTGKEIKRRAFHRDPIKFLKKREVQRTIDRLQPGKSKGNLLSNIQNINKPDELFPLGVLSKIKDTKNSLVIKSDESTPKLSLGSVLDSFGKHKFVDDIKKDEEPVKESSTQEPVVPSSNLEKIESDIVPKNQDLDKKQDKKPEVAVSTESTIGAATPNLSAWFKAFGAPKVVPPPKKVDVKSDSKESTKVEDVPSKPPITTEEEQKPKVVPPEISPNPDSPVVSQGQPMPRLRKMSTGSTVSERSSFSQDMDSPRICIDERMGSYPAPYPSPLHRSPSGASPIMASPRPDVSPKSAYPTVNGQIRVGFYQDTVSTKSSPEKSCSPRSNPQSPYPQYSEPVYTPSTNESTSYSYSSPYYSQISNYANSPTPQYGTEHTNNPPTYYDTSKPLTDQYQAKSTPNYHSANSPNYQSVHSPNYSAPDPQMHSPTPRQTMHSPNYTTPNPQMHSPTPRQQPPSYEVLHQQQQQPAPQPAPRLTEKSHSSAVFPVKKRVYNEAETTVQQSNNNQPVGHQNLYDRSYELGIIPGRQLTPTQLSQLQELRPNSRGASQHYVHQNIPNPRSNTRTPLSNEPYPKTNTLPQSVPPNTNNFTSSQNLYNYSNDSGYTLNSQPEGPLDLNARPDNSKKIDMSKYTNMGYATTDIGYSRNPPQYNLNYGRPASGTLANKTNELQNTISTNAQGIQNNEMMMRYNEATDYRNLNSQKQSHVNNLTTQNTENRLNSVLDVSNSYKTDMPIPRPSYSTPTTLTVDQTLGLRGNITNLSHIVDRFSTDNMYYTDKGLTGPHIYGKTMTTSTSNLPMFSQPSIAMPYNHEMQATQSSLYSRQMTDLQNSMSNQTKTPSFPPQQQEKKPKRRKSSKLAALPATTPAESTVSGASNQGFQSYTGLKNAPPMEPSAISLKTASVVPGSAFNFGPTPTGLGLGSGLYSDKDTYPNFLEDYRSAPNYYMAAAAAAAHHRSTPDTGDKQTRTSHQPPPPSATAGYPFIGAPQARPPSYPFMPPHQTPSLMDPSSPLYQQYLQAGVLHQGLLGAPSAYPTSYHPALSMRQPFDSMTRPPWL